MIPCDSACVCICSDFETCNWISSTLAPFSGRSVTGELIELFGGGGVGVESVCKRCRRGSERERRGSRALLGSICKSVKYV